MSISEAAGAILELINSRPRTPTQEEIEAVLFARWDPHEALVLERMEPRPVEAGSMPRGGCISSPLLDRILEAMAAQRAANKVAGGRLFGPEFDAAEAEVRTWDKRIEELEAEIPNPPRSDGDIVMRAVLARWFVLEDLSGVMTALDDGDVCDKRAARLIEAVLQRHGLDPAKPDSGLLGASQQSTAVSP